MKILLVEDDTQTARFIVKGLTQEGYLVEHAEDGLEGLIRATGESYDAAIMDIMLPKMDGFTLVEEIRSRKINFPVLILSARNSVDDRVKGLQKGGDDYLVKPFAFSELLARLQALIRRSSVSQNHKTFSVGNLKVDILKRRVFLDDEEIVLQPKEYALLEYLIRNTGHIVSKTMIIEHVWDYNFDPQTNVVEARICRLREKVEPENSKKLIHTVRGMGYVLEERE